MFCYRDYQLTTRFNQQNEKSTSKPLCGFTFLIFLLSEISHQQQVFPIQPFLNNQCFSPSLITYALISSMWSPVQRLTNPSWIWAFLVKVLHVSTLCLSLVKSCGWPGSCFFVPEHHHNHSWCLHGCLIYYFFDAIRICHFSLYSIW